MPPCLLGYIGGRLVLCVAVPPCTLLNWCEISAMYSSATLFARLHWWKISAMDSSATLFARLHWWKISAMAGSATLFARLHWWEISAMDGIGSPIGPQN